MEVRARSAPARTCSLACTLNGKQLLHPGELQLSELPLFLWTGTKSCLDRINDIAISFSQEHRIAIDGFKVCQRDARSFYQARSPHINQVSNLMFCR